MEVDFSYTVFFLDFSLDLKYILLLLQSQILNDCRRLNIYLCQFINSQFSCQFKFCIFYYKEYNLLSFVVHTICCSLFSSQMQLNYKEQIVISCNKLYIQDIFSGQKFSIKNLSQKFVYVSAILSNIDNYTLNKSQFILQSRGECIISIKPKIYDKISKFNFVNNKIFVICLILQKQTCIQKIDLEKELKSLWIKQILIEVNCENILQIHQQTRVKLKKVAKITRYNKKPLTQVQFGKIQKVCEKIGEIIQILDAQSIILIKFSHAVQIIPKLYIGKGYLFTLSYLSTQTGKQNINLDKQIKHNVPQITNLFVFEQLIVCYNQNNLYIINQFSKEVKQFTLAKNEKVFSSSRYICIVIHDQYVKIFQNYEKINITKVQIRYLKIQYLCQFHQSMYVSGVNQNNKFNQQKNQLFLIQKFNLKKSVIIPDYKFTIIQENLKIEKFIAYKNSLIIFWKKGFCIYSLRKKQIIVKIKKEIHQLNLLLGKQSYNYLNCIGLNLKKELFFINIQKYGQQSFGSEVFQYQKHVQSYCQSPSGKIYLVINNSIYQYFVKNRQVQSYPIYKPTRDNLIKFIRSFNEDHLIVYIETKSSSWFVLVQIQKKKYYDFILILNIMRSVQKKQEYERSIIGMIKDISFHELFIEKFREENAKNDLFDFELAYQIIDTFKSGKVSPYEIQGFLAKNQFESTQNQCEQIVTSIDKSAIFISKKYFMEICMPINRQLRSQSLNRYERIKVSINDFGFWTRIKIETQRQLVKLFTKQIQFYRELQERRQTFCHSFYGDIYSIVNVFNHQDQINYQMLYELCKKYKIILNKDEYQALIRRAVSITQQTKQTINKKELVGLIVTKNLNLKPTFKRKYEISKRYDPLNFSYHSKENLSNTFNTQLQESIYQKVLKMEQPKDLRYQYCYPEVKSKFGIGFLRLQQKSKQIQQMIYKVSTNPTLQRIYYNSTAKTTLSNFNNYTSYGLYPNKY